MIHNGNPFNLTPDMQASPSTMAHTGQPAPDWDTTYGKAFRLTQTPQGAASNEGKPMETQPGSISLVTPYNGDAFTNWPEASDEAKNNFKSNWNDIWNQTGGYKQRQVLGVINNGGK